MSGLSQTQLWEAIRESIRSSYTVTSRNLRAQYQVFKTISHMGTAPLEPPRNVDVNLPLESKRTSTLKELESAVKASNPPEQVNINLALEKNKGRILSGDA